MQKSSINLVKSFLIAFIRFAKNKFEIVNRCHYEDEVRSNPIYVDCFVSLAMTVLSLAHSVRLMAMTIKNNFVNLNLVKTFLTSITFDSLSREIKNPCLVIKKLYQKEIFKMYILKTKKIFTYMVVGALITALFISCKNDDKTGSGDDYSVPTATGDPATDLTDGTYSGNLTLTAQEGNPTEDVSRLDGFTLTITGNKAEAGIGGALANAQVLKSGSEYSANGESNQDGLNAKEYIKFTVSGDSVTITYIVAISGDGQSYKLTYDGTLTKQAS